MMEEERPVEAPTLVALGSSSDQERGNPIETERSPLLGVAGAVVYNATGTTGEEDITPATIGHGTDGEGHKDSDGDCCVDAAAYRPHVHISRIRVLTIYCALSVGIFLVAVDQTLITTLLPRIGTTFESSTALSWIATAYLIASASLQPLSGKLSDIFGRRSGLLWCNIVFGLGTFWCTVAGSVSGMVAGRIVAGLGGAGLTSIAAATVSDIVSIQNRGIFLGVSNVTFGLGSGLGGVFGGWISDRWGWRCAFGVQVPVIIISTIAIAKALDLPAVPQTTTGENNPIWKNTAATAAETEQVIEIERQQESVSRLSRVDFPGSVTLVTALALLLTAINSGGNFIPWTHPLIITSLSLAGLFLAAFFYIETYIAKEPIMPLHLFTDPSVLAACFVNWFMVMGVYSILFFIPLLPLLLPHPPATSYIGLLLAPYSFGLPFGSLLSGFLLRIYLTTHPTTLVFLILFTSASLIFPLLYINQVPSLYIHVPNMVILGTAFGGNLTCVFITLLTHVPHEAQAVITAASYTSRMMGGAIGVAISGAIFQNLLATGLDKRLAGKGPEAQEWIEKVKKSFELIKDAPETVRKEIVASFAEALHGVWLFVGVVGVMALICGLRMKRTVLEAAGARSGR